MNVSKGFELAKIFISSGRWYRWFVVGLLSRNISKQSDEFIA
jgi:hypothetical protein